MDELRGDARVRLADRLVAPTRAFGRGRVQDVADFL
jgi:hypothetical protein